MTKNNNKVPLYQSPIYLVVILAISVIVAEMQIMICFHFLPPFPMVIGAVIDSLLLFILLLPIIVGKIVVPAEILSKPSQLNEYEYGIVKSHPRVGYDILKRLEFPWPVAQIILQHHEMVNGSGYPMGLKGEEITFEARILAVADVVEAMSGHRPYRAALGIR